MEGLSFKHTFIKHCVGEIHDYIALYDNFSGEQVNYQSKPMDEYIITPSLTFTFIKSGNIIIDINGHTNAVSSGQSVTLNKNVNYSVRSVSADCQYFSIEIDDSLIDEAKRILDINLGLLHIEKNSYIVDDLSEKSFSYILQIYLNMIYWSKKQSNPYHHLILKQFANIILITKVNALGDFNDERVADRKGAVSRQYVIFENFIKLLELHADQHRDVKFYADELKVTPKYLSAVTHIYTGKSAISSIEEFVINKVKAIMGERAYSIQQICKLMNFNSQSFFGRYFKRITGMSPREYMLSINHY